MTMTDLSLLTIEQLRELQAKVADGQFLDELDTGIEPFDELAWRYKRDTGAMT